MSAETQPPTNKRYQAHHTYEAQQDDELHLEKGDIVIVTDQSDPDWWTGETTDGKSGLFPSNFVEPVEEEAPAESVADENKTATGDEPDATTEGNAGEEAGHDRDETPPARVIGIARVMEDYAMQEQGEITLHRGVIVNILEDNGEYMKGEINGKVGVFPSKYVEFTEIPGQPEFGRPSSLGQSADETEVDNKPKQGFKLAAYGVKQGGIGSLLAGGIPVLRPGGAKRSPSQDSGSKPEVQSPKSPASLTKSPETTPIPAPQVSSPQAISSPATPPSRSGSVSQSKETKAIVTHHYDPDQEDELSLMKGEYVVILERDADDDWWKGRNERGEIGVFPSNFVKEISDETPPPPPSRSSRGMSATSESVKSPGVGAARPPLARPPSVPGGSRPSSYASNRASSISENAPKASPPPVSTSSRPSSVVENTGMASPPPLPTTKRPSSTADSGSINAPPLPISSPPARGLSYTSTTSVPSQDTSSIERKDSKEDGFQSPIQANQPDLGSDVEAVPSAAQMRFDEDISDIGSDVPSSMAVEVSSSVGGENVDEVADNESSHSEAGHHEGAPSESAGKDFVDAKPETEVAPETAPAESDATKEPEQAEVAAEEEAEQPIEKPTEVELPESATEEAEETPKADIEPAAASDALKDNAEPEEADTTAKEAAEVVESEESKPDFSAITSGPKLATPNRARPSRGRRPQEHKAAEPSQTSVLEEDINKQPEVKEEKPKTEEKSAPSPPAKPMKPIFQKFPTPFAGADTTSRNLKPVQRRMWEPVESTQESSAEKKPEEKKEEPPRGVKNISSRFQQFAGVPSGGGNEVLETKLKNHTKNEVEKARKEFERQLAEEREERSKLEDKVADLTSKLEALMAQIGQE
ncbi:hypothetical protein NQZ79_g3773 [Umbelopsis isabellina]|nr:hypothetical protein NQZ79_g3773 [Umbelopsis isabellina]